MRRELVLVVDGPEKIDPALSWVFYRLRAGLLAGAVQLSISRPRRSVDQNSKLWPMLKDVSDQVVWHGLRLTPSEWKDVLTAGIKKQKVVPGIDGGFVVIGARTSQMRKKDFCELVEFIYWFGAEKGVRWSQPVRTGSEVWKESPL